MTANVGTIDRALRALVGAALVLAALFSSATLFSGVTGWIVAAIGVVLLATSAMKFCPAYRILGIQTCRT